ncbi:MAG TPA: FtsQ-type POTRA domain-containing protein [Thermoanaerobaculia bacterium]
MKNLLGRWGLGALGRWGTGRRARGGFDEMGRLVVADAPRSRRFGWVVLALALITLMGGLSQSPRLLRRMDTFRVRQVEVRGTRFLAPDEVLRVSGLGETSSVFDSPDAWIAALETHPMIRSVRVERRLPSTVRIVVTETQPVALVRSTTLLPVDGEGRVLPIAPEAARLDLPILMANVDMLSTGYVDSRAQDAVRALARLQAEEPALAAAVSEFDGGNALRLLLRLSHPTVALLPLEPSALRLNEMRRTLDDLARRGELPQTLVVDGRFEGQVVVSLNTTGSI